ncbi:DUF2306 domain-containing protein [Paenibacillus sp. CF384]|uniref:DUF2306 domain-containing protein n=1 Tax=Paenibacillus sp. CF384 TaxID=1884382 RepID=UPI00089AD108|nr:DUF2306 domain-containing protein [Paenibacillus sp. CF384]SDX57460.1 Predicted membrane protein [Paenibacillus sp. CF384]
MQKSNILYRCMLVIAIGFIVYVISDNFILDPQAENFLSHKINLKHPLNKPVWLNVMYVHVVCACIAIVAGAVNFAPKVQNHYRRVHRVIGYVYFGAILVVVLTSGYMAPYATGGKLNSVPFNLVSILWSAMTLIAIVKIRRKQRIAHRNWMVRSYAFCYMNLCIHAITYVAYQGFGLSYTHSYTVGVYGAILFLLLAAEFVIRVVYGRRSKGM